MRLSWQQNRMKGNLWKCTSETLCCRVHDFRRPEPGREKTDRLIQRTTATHANRSRDLLDTSALLAVCATIWLRIMRKCVLHARCDLWIYSCVIQMAQSITCSAFCLTRDHFHCCLLFSIPRWFLFRVCSRLTHQHHSAQWCSAYANRGRLTMFV